MKKKLNILLICAVSIIWGAIIYRLVSQYFFTPKVALNYAITNENKLKITEKDTFDLQNLSRDPFMGTISAGTPARTTRQHKTFFTAKPKPALTWPQIKYFGFIKSKDHKGELVLIQINGRLNKLKKGEIKDNITVKRIYKDSIELGFNKVNKTFRLE